MGLLPLSHSAGCVGLKFVFVFALMQASKIWSIPTATGYGGGPSKSCQVRAIFYCISESILMISGLARKTKTLGGYFVTLFVITLMFAPQERGSVPASRWIVGKAVSRQRTTLNQEMYHRELMAWTSAECLLLTHTYLHVHSIAL